MYAKLGWYSPFIFSIAVCAIDLVLRLIVLERRHYPQLFKPKGSRIPIPGRPDSLDIEIPSDVQVSSGREKVVVKELSLFGVVIALFSSPRGVTACSLMFVYGLVLSAMDPT
jgi:hypothetical protein